MQCQRLLQLTKGWYLNVKDETMAPARMIQFIKDHVAQCDTCLIDPDIQDEIEKITTMILPESKIPKAVRLQQEKDDEIAAAEAEEKKESEEEEKEEYMDDDDEDLDEDLNKDIDEIN